MEKQLANVKNQIPVSPTPAQPKSKALDMVMPFVIGGTSGVVATLFIQPIDMVKVQIQIKSEKMGKTANLSPFTIVSDMLKNGNGVKQFYKGLDSALIRQVTYTTTRLGVYKTLFERELKEKGKVTATKKALFGLSAGFIGSIIGNPADLILIRLQSDSSFPVEKRRNYIGFSDAFTRIIKEEGITSLWKGSGPTICRAMVINFAMLGPFDQVKEFLNKQTGTKDTLQTRLMAACVAGFLSSYFSLPFDNAKTKIQKMAALPDGSFPYKGLVDCMMKTVKNEGFLKLWAGFPTFYVRIAPHAMISLMCQDFLTDLYKGKAK